ncbi:MAG TPA: glycosyl hydrolase family 8 [Polyangiales bacterium]|nr:glycosyl hydrolase family 8 [Polyangiales bacterium]
MVAGAAGGALPGGGAGGGGAVVPNPDSMRACAPASLDVISDFEENNGVLVKQGTPPRTGWWGVYSEKGTLTPAKSTTAIPVAASGDTAMCNKYALHVTGAGIGTYGGFNASFLPMAPPSESRAAYDVSEYAGIRFKIKAGSGTPPVIFVEMQTKQNQPTKYGGNLNEMNPGPDSAIGLFNGRGQIVTDVTTAWKTVHVPFGSLIPRWVPAAGATNACPAPAANVAKCQSPKFVPTDVLGLQFSFYTEKSWPKPAGSTEGNFDVWIDDVEFYKSTVTDDTPAPPKSGGMKPFPQDAPMVGTCAKPTGPAVGGKFLVHAYNQWKAKFVVAANGGFRVQRPENNNDSVSEGIAYGMLIAVAMDDKPLFDGLYKYWSTNLHNGGPLMTWQVPGGSGTATDADEDAAMALLLASKQWIGNYLDEARKLMGAVLSTDMRNNTILAGSNYNGGPLNPSYFAPAWYHAFAAVDTANAAAWNGLADKAYSLLNGISGTNGLVPAWCNDSCTAAATNSGSQNPATDVIYQYDSHRMPWRVGLDYCWYGTAAAKAYVDKISSFFSTSADAGKDGIGRIFDMYQLNGRPASNTAVNSASILGTAAVGAMAAGAAQKAFLDDAYQATFDLTTRATLAEFTDGKTAYSYYNATVGMLTLLTLTGNIPKP